MLVFCCNQWLNPGLVVRVYVKAGSINRVWHPYVQLVGDEHIILRGEDRIDTAQSIVDGIAALLNRTPANNNFVAAPTCEPLPEKQTA